jgi:hypothetical protein
MLLLRSYANEEVTTVRKVLLFFCLPLLLIIVVGVVVLVIVTSPADRKPPLPKSAAEKTITLHDLILQVPDSWEVKSQSGVDYTQDCSQSPCGQLLVYGDDVLRQTNWQAIVTLHKCQANPSEAQGPITPRGTTMIGNRGAYRYTMERCGVSHSEILEVWRTELPPRLIISQRGAGLPNMDARLTHANWK